MIIITIKPLKAELVDFSIQDETAEINILFRDEADEHKLAINRKIEDAEELAEQMIMEMRRIVKKHHTPDSDSYDEILAIRVENEDDVVSKMKSFFEKTKEKINQVRMIKSSKGYLDTLAKAKQLEIEF